MSFGVIPKSSDGVPLGTIVIPGNSTPMVLKGGNLATDGNNNNLLALCVIRDATTVLNQAFAAKTVTGNTADLAVGAFTELLIGFNITAVSGTSPTIQFSLDTKGPDGVHYNIWMGSQYTTQPQKGLVSIGVGCAVNSAFGDTVRINWTIGGVTPSWTFSLWCVGK